MPRIYFDTNVFSNLKSNSTPLYEQLNELLLEYKSNLTFFFSHAHIRDKIRDKSDHKFGDFDFIHSYTGDNYLSYHAIKGNTSHYLATPLMVFEDENKEDFDLRSLFKGVGSSSFGELFESFLKLPFSFDIPIPTEISEEQLQVLDKLIPLHRENATIGDLINRQLQLYEDLETDHQLYKDIRNLVDEGINKGKYTLHAGDLNFNEALKDSVLQKTFIEFALANTTKRHDGNVLYYDYYQQAYHCLDLLGIKKEKLSKKNGYTNMMTDGLHSYYARYCDYMVSADGNICEKSRALYSLFDVHTKVLSVEQFIYQLPQIGPATDPNLFVFFEKLSRDIREGKTINQNIEKERESKVIQIDNIYFGFFDVIMEVRENGFVHYFIRKDPSHHLSSPNFREQGKVIDQAVKIFGQDVQGRNVFDFSKEVAEIEAGEWQGRIWRIGSLIVFLQRHEGLNEFCLLVSPAEIYG